MYVQGTISRRILSLEAVSGTQARGAVEVAIPLVHNLLRMVVGGTPICAMPTQTMMALRMPRLVFGGVWASRITHLHFRRNLETHAALEMLYQGQRLRILLSLHRKFHVPPEKRTLDAVEVILASVYLRVRFHAASMHQVHVHRISF